MRIYIASSWKNAVDVRALSDFLKRKGHTVYDFTHKHFNWASYSDIPDTEWYAHEKVLEHYGEDLEAIHNCDLLIALLPAGNSTHMELGIAMGFNMMRGGSTPTTITVGERVKDLIYIGVDFHYDVTQDLLREYFGYSPPDVDKYFEIYSEWYVKSTIDKEWLNDDY